MKEIYLFVFSFVLCILFFILVDPLNKLISKKYTLFQPILLSIVFAIFFVFLKKHIIKFKENMEDNRINGLEDFSEEEISKCENIYATMSKVLNDLKYDESIDDETYDSLDIEKLHREQFPDMSDEFFEKFAKLAAEQGSGPETEVDHETVIQKTSSSDQTAATEDDTAISSEPGKTSPQKGISLPIWLLGLAIVLGVLLYAFF